RGGRGGRAQRGDPAQPRRAHLRPYAGTRVRAGPHAGVAGPRLLVRAAGGDAADAERERAHRGKRRDTGAALWRGGAAVGGDTAAVRSGPAAVRRDTAAVRTDTAAVRRDTAAGIMRRNPP